MNGKDTKNADVVVNHDHLALMLNEVKICLWKTILVLLGIVIYTMYPSPLFPSYYLIFLFCLYVQLKIRQGWNAWLPKAKENIQYSLMATSMR